MNISLENDPYLQQIIQKKISENLYNDLKKDCHQNSQSNVFDKQKFLNFKRRGIQNFNMKQRKRLDIFKPDEFNLETNSLNTKNLNYLEQLKMHKRKEMKSIQREYEIKDKELIQGQFTLNKIHSNNLNTITQNNKKTFTKYLKMFHDTQKGFAELINTKQNFFRKVKKDNNYIKLSKTNNECSDISITHQKENSFSNDIYSNCINKGNKINNINSGYSHPIDIYSKLNIEEVSCELSDISDKLTGNLNVKKSLNNQKSICKEKNSNLDFNLISGMQKGNNIEDDKCNQNSEKCKDEDLKSDNSLKKEENEEYDNEEFKEESTIGKGVNDYMTSKEKMKIKELSRNEELNQDEEKEDDKLDLEYEVK